MRVRCRVVEGTVVETDGRKNLRRATVGFLDVDSGVWDTATGSTMPLLVRLQDGRIALHDLASKIGDDVYEATYLIVEPVDVDNPVRTSL